MNARRKRGEEGEDSAHGDEEVSDDEEEKIKMGFLKDLLELQFDP